MVAGNATTWRVQFSTHPPMQFAYHVYWLDVIGDCQFPIRSLHKQLRSFRGIVWKNMSCEIVTSAGFTDLTFDPIVSPSLAITQEWNVSIIQERRWNCTGPLRVWFVTHVSGRNILSQSKAWRKDNQIGAHAPTVEDKTKVIWSKERESAAFEERAADDNNKSFISKNITHQARDQSKIRIKKVLP